MSNPFMGKGQCLPYWQTTLLEKEKILRLMISYGFAVLGTSDIRRKETPKEARRINAERKHRRLEKKENCWKTQKKQGKDKVCSFHFHFILWTWGWCVLGRIFGFVVRMRDKKARVQRRKWHNINGPIFFFFFFLFLLQPDP